MLEVCDARIVVQGNITISARAPLPNPATAPPRIRVSRLATDKHLRNDQAPHSSNGAETAATFGPFGPDQKESGIARIRDRIGLTNGSMMDLKKATIRKVLEYFLKSNDSDAWKEFTERILKCVRGAAAKTLHKCAREGPVELLEDLEQDTHCKLLAKDCARLRDFRWEHDDSIYSYVKVVAISATWDWIRKHRTTPEPLDEKMPVAAPTLRSDGDILRMQIDKALFTLVREPNFERDRRIFWLYFRWGYTAPQIAKLPPFNLPVRKVENILLRLRGKVRSVLGTSQGKGAGA